MVANKPGAPGRLRISVKTAAQGMPVESALPVVPAACIFSAGGPWVRPSPGIPCALCIVARDELIADLGRDGAARLQSYVDCCLSREFALRTVVVPDKPRRAPARRGADPGPIRRGRRDEQTANDQPGPNCSLGLWVPAQGRDDSGVWSCRRVGKAAVRRAAACPPSCRERRATWWARRARERRTKRRSRCAFAHPTHRAPRCGGVDSYPIAGSTPQSAARRRRWRRAAAPTSCRPS